MSIIRLANDLIRWTKEEHPVEKLRTSLASPFIEPAPPGDPNPTHLISPTRFTFMPPA